VGRILYERRMRELQHNGSRVFLKGAEAIGLCPDRVPGLAEVNARLERRTGWNAVPVNGFIPARQVFECLAQHRFPTTVIVRPRAQIDYLPEPDIFHDVFGHVPLHADAVFADFLQKFGAAATRTRNEEETVQMARLFWFTVEFGLTRDEGHVKVYGSGLISSAGNAANALGPKCDRRPFSLDAAIHQPFESIASRTCSSWSTRSTSFSRRSTRRAGGSPHDRGHRGPGSPRWIRIPSSPVRRLVARWRRSSRIGKIFTVETASPSVPR